MSSQQQPEAINGISLFSGIGGIDLGLKLAMPTYRTVCYVEREPYCVEVLKARIGDGCIDDAPIWDDVRTFNGRPWTGRVDIVAGGFPCQDLSCAGKRAGLECERSGLWFEMLRIVGEVRPRFVFMENVPGILTAGGALGTVLGGLATCGYDVLWDCIPASACGAPHRRDRWWALAYTTRCGAGGQGEGNEDPRLGSAGRGEGQPGGQPVTGVANAVRRRCNGGPHDEGQGQAERVRAGQDGEDVDNPMRRRHGTPQEAIPPRRDGTQHASWWSTEPDVGRVAHGVPARVDRLRALGNGVVPIVVQRFFQTLWSRG